MRKNSQLLFKPSGWSLFDFIPSSHEFSRDLVSAYLPADQNHALMKVAGTVMELHSECVQKAKLAKAAAMSTLPPPPTQSPAHLASTYVN